MVSMNDGLKLNQASNPKDQPNLTGLGGLPGLPVAKSPRRSRPPKGRQLACPTHPGQPLLGNGQKYFLHLLSAEELIARGMAAGKAKLVINAYPVLVLSKPAINLRTVVLPEPDGPSIEKNSPA